MPERHYHALEFVPRRSDPTRKWALSVKQPLAGLVATGRTSMITKSTLPPPELIGKRIALHAGAGDVPYKAFSEGAKEWCRKVWGCELADLRLALPHGAVIATVQLSAAFLIGRVIDGRAYRAPTSAARATFSGTWTEHDMRPIFEMGEKLEGRFAWALTHPQLCARPVPLKGMGGIFDLEKAREQQRSEAGSGASRHEPGSGLRGKDSSPEPASCAEGAEADRKPSPEPDPSREARGSNQGGHHGA